VWLHDHGRVEYTVASDSEAVAAFHLLAETEGILPALESAHALAEVTRRAPALSTKHTILVNLSGRGDKDVESVIEFDEERAGLEPGKEETLERRRLRSRFESIPRAAPQERPHGAPRPVPQDGAQEVNGPERSNGSEGGPES
jgi:threonine synthase